MYYVVIIKIYLSAIIRKKHKLDLSKDAGLRFCTAKRHYELMLHTTFWIYESMKILCRLDYYALLSMECTALAESSHEVTFIQLVKYQYCSGSRSSLTGNGNICSQALVITVP